MTAHVCLGVGNNCCGAEACRKVNDAQQLRAMRHDLFARMPQVMGCTCLGAGHALLQRHAFDVCLVDEAGQISLPAVLGPLLRARKFVLVGDHCQLPPLVTSRAAEAGGLGVSLFRRLCEAHPQARD
jgi:DNA replication ATP-dependent helicase Dna2